MRPERIGTMASAELGVKLSISSTSASFPYHPRQRRNAAIAILQDDGKSLEQVLGKPLRGP